MNNQKHTPKHAGDVTKSLKKAAFSYISLFLIVMVLIGTTVSWFTVQDTATLKSDVMVFNSGSGLRVNDGEDITNHITINSFTLDETSSVDGRNIFLPNGKLQSGVTGEMLYREATAGDKNKKFMYADFKLKGNSAGNIPVYIKSYKITVGKEGDSSYEVYDGSTEIKYSDPGKYIPKEVDSHKKCPLRIAFIEDSQDTPKVIDPSVLVNESAWKYNAVNSVDSTGVPSTTQSTAKSFSHYYFANSTSGTPLFNLNGSTAINASIVAWLEGTDDELGQSNSNDFAGLPISIDIELESNYEDMETVTFVDQTKGEQGDGKGQVVQWIGNDECMVTMTYTDTTTKVKNADGTETNPVRTVVMTPSKKKDNGNAIEWTAPIPKAVITEITFNRYQYTKKKISEDNKGCSELIYNAWYTNERVDTMWSRVGHDSSLVERTTFDKTRKFDGVNSTKYIASWGNSYGITSKANERLSPCQGYWERPSTQTSSTVASTATTTSAAPTTTTVKPDYYDVVAILRVSNDDCKFDGDTDSIRKHLDDGEKMYIHFSDGNSLVMETLETNDGCQWSGKINIKDNPDIAVTGFSMKVGDKEYSLKVDNNGYQYTSSSTVTFNVNGDGKTVNYSS